MAITGYLAEFSLAEIFQFLEQGHKTGQLTITFQSHQHSSRSVEHYIWFRQGVIVAAANEKNGRGLYNLLHRRGWLGDEETCRLAQACPPGTPLGPYLKSRNILKSEQLKLLFYIQVMQQICALFIPDDGAFCFKEHTAIPLTELTGLSAPAMEVTLSGLRALRNWSALADKLPDASSTLVRVIQGQPRLRLKPFERQVWELSDGRTPVRTIADCLSLPPEKVRQIAFRLIVVGLIEELPMLGPDLANTHFESDSLPLPPMSDIPNDHKPVSSAQEQGLSESFLQGLMGFLAGKTGSPTT